MDAKYVHAGPGPGLEIGRTLDENESPGMDVSISTWQSLYQGKLFS